MGMLDKCSKCSNQIVFVNKINGGQKHECLVSVVLLDNTVIDIYMNVSLIF